MSRITSGTLYAPSKVSDIQWWRSHQYLLVNVASVGEKHADVQRFLRLLGKNHRDEKRAKDFPKKFEEAN